MIIKTNPMVALAALYSSAASEHTKQPGRRYGPSPRSTVSGQGAPRAARREVAGA